MTLPSATHGVPVEKTSSDNEKASIEKRELDSYIEDIVPGSSGDQGKSTENINAKLANPLAGIPHEQLMADAEAFAKRHGLGHLSEVFKKGALVAQDPLAFESLSQLSEEDKICLRREVTHKWDQPKMLYYLVVLCSLAAAVQGVRVSRVFFAYLK